MFVIILAAYYFALIDLNFGVYKYNYFAFFAVALSIFSVKTLESILKFYRGVRREKDCILYISYTHACSVK